MEYVTQFTSVCTRTRDHGNESLERYYQVTVFGLDGEREEFEIQAENPREASRRAAIQAECIGMQISYVDVFLM